MARAIGSGLDSYLQREARERALNIAMEAREASERLIREAEEEAASRREQVLARALSQLEARKRQAIAQARLEARRIVAGRRQELLERLWQEAEECLKQQAVGEPERRLRTLDALIADAAEQMGGGELEVAVCAADRPLLTEPVLRELEERLRPLGVTRLTLAEAPEGIWGGAVVRGVAGHVAVDNSFDARLALAKRTLRDEVGMILVPREHDIG